MKIVAILATVTFVLASVVSYTMNDPPPQDILLKQQSKNSLPYCRSGNEYLSLEKGGAWVDTGVTKEEYSPEEIPDKYVTSLLCYQQEGYNDTYSWQPPCRSLALLTPTSNDMKLSPIKVLLWGDSLTTQIWRSATQLRPKDYPKPKFPIKYLKFAHREPFHIQSSNLVFESPKSPFCQETINSNPKGFYLKKYTSEQSIIDDVFKYGTYDYVFFNHYAHHAGHFTKHVWGCYASNNLTWHDLIIDSLNHYTKEMELIARALRENFPTTKVYYRTSSHQVYNFTPAYQPLPKERLPQQTYADCVESPATKNQHFWRCASTYNAIAMTAFKKYGHGVLDTAPALDLRVDAHPCSSNPKSLDCNHFCTPGPPDVQLQALEAEIFAREAEKQKG